MKVTRLLVKYETQPTDSSVRPPWTCPFTNPTFSPGKKREVLVLGLIGPWVFKGGTDRGRLTRVKRKLR